MTRKACIRCHEVKPLEDYYRDNGRADKHQGTCKDCQTERYLGRGARWINEMLKNWERA